MTTYDEGYRAGVEAAAKVADIIQFRARGAVRAARRPSQRSAALIAEETAKQIKDGIAALSPSPAPDVAASLRAALETIRRTPSMPFPDPNAHSPGAWSTAVYRAWADIQEISKAALTTFEKETKI